MKLPNGEHAIADIRKLQDYCLNPSHPGGRNKARVFASFGIRRSDASALRLAILKAAISADARPGVACEYGQRWILDFDYLQAEQMLRIRTAWIVRASEKSPRLVSCYVL